MAGQRTGVLAALAALAGCAAAVPSAEAEPVRSIAYETGPCFGGCPVYRFIVRSDGSGTFEGRRFTAAEGTHEFSVTPDQFRAFAAHLEPLRPADGSVNYSGPDMCGTLATDLPSVTVEWETAGADMQRLYYYYGCDMETRRALAERLRKAPDLLPVARLVRID
jgi:hypothetical protein